MIFSGEPAEMSSFCPTFTSFLFLFSLFRLSSWKKKWSNPTIQQRGKGRGRVGAVNAIDDPLVVGFFVLLPAKINGPERGR